MSNQSAQKADNAPSLPNLSGLEATEIEQPDEDTREELNLPEMNMVLVKDQAKKNSETLAEIEDQKPMVLHKFTAKVRPALGFMQQPVQVWAADELIDEAKWKRFVDDVSWGISDRTAAKKVLAVFVVD